MNLRPRLADAAMSAPMVKIIAPLSSRRVRHLGVTIDTELVVFDQYTRAELFWGIYERTECRYIQRYLHGSRFVIELGAGLGVSSAHIAAGMATGGSLVCIEANPEFIPAVQRNVRRYAQRADISATVINAGIAPDGAAMRFDRLPHRFASRMTAHEQPGTIRVATRSLRSIVDEHICECFDLVSDIEGGESSFILGEDAAALECCRRLVIELHDGELDGRPFRPEDLAHELTTRLGFAPIELKGAVGVFERS